LEVNFDNSKQVGFFALTTLKQIADVNFPTPWADFRLLGFEVFRIDPNTNTESRETALALVLGNNSGISPIVRIHSQCITGEVFHSLRCDCRDQLHLALRLIADEGSGVLVYEYQEGRGIGLMEKLRAYGLQDQGLDTIDANLELGYAVDSRDYEIPVQVLRYLKIGSLRLISNNPDKVNAVLAAGICIVERIDADVLPNVHSARYLNTKRQRLGHLSSHISDMSVHPNRCTYEAPSAESCNVDVDSGDERMHEIRGGMWLTS
jgi:GTP cyclohydrolase II